jgi:hypothetical protein
MYRLDKASYIGGVDEDTPECILMDVSESQGIFFEEGVTRREKIDHLNHSGFETDDLADVARWVNRNEKWDSKSLLAAYHHILSNNENEVLSEPSSPNPTSMGLIQIYKKVKKFANREFSKNDIIQTYQLSKQPKVILQEMARTKVKSMKEEELIKFVGKSLIKMEEFVFNPSILSTPLYDALTGILSLQENIVPTRHATAIGLAAMVYGLDISRTKSPLSEYEQIKMFLVQGNNIRKYTSPNVIDLSIHFSPNIPVKYYSSSTLEYHMNRNKVTSYEALIELSSTPTFYPGLLPDTDPVTSISLEDTKNRKDVFCYGTFNGTKISILPSELEMMFGYTKSLFFPGVDLNPRNVERLLSLCESGPLRDLIISIQMLRSETDLLVHTMIEDEKNKEEYRSLFTDLFHLGMYMRGWVGDGPYPDLVSITETTKFGNVEVLVTDAMRKVMANPLYKKISGFPTYSYANDEYLKSTDKLSTILTRVREGTGCIRVSSNYLCTSSNYYVKMLGYETFFTPKNLRWIS